MYLVYLDESDKEGPYYSNFYGGIILKHDALDDFNARIRNIMANTKIADEEIKWQKVNALTLPIYMVIVDELFRFLAEGKARIRIFFRHNRHKPVALTAEDKRNEYTKLYYQFVKHAFGFSEAPRDGDNRLRLFIDEMPISPDQRKTFLTYLYGLKETPPFKRRNVYIIPNGVAEVDSKDHLPLQVMDVIMGAMCFRLNNKHKLKDAVTGKRPKRTVCKEKLYKHIRNKVCVITGRQFNIGESTGINSNIDRWEMPYRHWSFVPRFSEITDEYNKP